MNFNDIPTYKLPWNEEVTYWKLNEIKKVYDSSLEEEKGRFYLLGRKIEGFALEFICFERCGGEDDDWVTLIAKGSICHVDGKGSIRHIHWGENGYIFYFNVEIGLRMLNCLKKYLSIHGHEID